MEATTLKTYESRRQSQEPFDTESYSERTPHGNRLRQLQRVLLVIELLTPLRRGATLQELVCDVACDLGPVCGRTIRRDLEALECMGLVERVEGVPAVWLWCDHGTRGKALARASEAIH